MRYVRFVFLSAALLIVGSCGASPTRPEPRESPPPPPSAEISVGTITPGSGAMLIFHDCGRAGLCTDQLQTTFDVLVAGDIPDAAVIVSLGRDSLPCAWAYVRQTLTGGNRASFSTSSMEVVYDEGGRPLCPLPTETTSLAFEVFYPNAPAKAVLARELPYRYRLATQ